MTTEYIKRLIAKGELYKFYTHREWRRKKAEVLARYNNECQICKKKFPGKVVKAEVVHHVRFLSRYPELALSDYYEYNGERYAQLLPLCRDCHEKIHDRAKKIHLAKMAKLEREKKWNDEKW